MTPGPHNGFFCVYNDYLFTQHPHTHFVRSSSIDAHLRTRHKPVRCDAVLRLLVLRLLPILLPIILLPILPLPILPLLR